MLFLVHSFLSSIQFFCGKPELRSVQVDTDLNIAIVEILMQCKFSILCMGIVELEADDIKVMGIFSAILYWIMQVNGFLFLQCDNYEIRPGKHLGVCISVANNRLFVGSIPKNKTKENILEEFNKVTGKHLHHDFCHGCKIPLSLFHSCSNVTDAFRSYLNYFQILFQNFILKYTLW